MTLQYNANGHLIWHMCQTTDDPNALNHLMAECCCDCTPDIRETYYIDWQQYSILPGGQDFFWSDYYGGNRCQIFRDSTPFEVTYFKWRESSNECTWRSANFHSSPSVTRWTHLDMVWYGNAGVWQLQVNGSSALSDTPLTTCNDPHLVFAGAPLAKTDRCDPTGTYTPLYAIKTDNYYGSGEIGLRLKIIVS